MQFDWITMGVQSWTRIIFLDPTRPTQTLTRPDPVQGQYGGKQ